MTPINEKEISLFRLKSELVELMQLREAEELSVEERAAIDGQVKAYLTAELRKVDNVRAYLRHCEMMQEAAADEVKRLSALGHTWKGRRERLLEVCRELMLEFGEKRLEGLHGSIILKGNGGLQALEMGNPSLIPEELCDYRGMITSKCWNAIVKMCLATGHEITEWEGVQLERTPRVGMVREALKGECSKCCGNGQRIVYHQSMDEGGHVSERGYDEKCPDCGGSGKATVAGARLAERGVHVEVK